jgi:hypothetical protein
MVASLLIKIGPALVNKKCIKKSPDQKIYQKNGLLEMPLLIIDYLLTEPTF